jgi:hypothetical protein
VPLDATLHSRRVGVVEELRVDDLLGDRSPLADVFVHEPSDEGLVLLGHGRASSGDGMMW